MGKEAGRTISFFKLKAALRSRSLNFFILRLSSFLCSSYSTSRRLPSKVCKVIVEAKLVFLGVYPSSV